MSGQSQSRRVRDVVNAQRNTVSVGYGSGIAGITVRDMHLRTVQVPLTISVAGIGLHSAINITPKEK